MHIRGDLFSYSNLATGLGLPYTSPNTSTSLAGTGNDGDDDSAVQGAQVASNSNPIMEALAQALQSLGLSLSQGVSPPSPVPDSSSNTGSSVSQASGSQASSGTSSSSGSASTTPASTGNVVGNDDDNGSSHAARQIARDIRHLVHALFQDVQAEDVLAPASSSSGTSVATPSSTGTTGAAQPVAATGSTAVATTASPFAFGLTALISQVTSGSVPANLQNAFNKLVTDLERIGGVTLATSNSTGSTAGASTTTGSNSSATSGAGSTSNTPTTQALLLTFLTNLQQDLGAGYGAAANASGGSSTTGVLLNQVA